MIDMWPWGRNPCIGVWMLDVTRGYRGGDIVELRGAVWWMAWMLSGYYDNLEEKNELRLEYCEMSCGSSL